MVNDRLFQLYLQHLAIVHYACRMDGTYRDLHEPQVAHTVNAESLAVFDEERKRRKKVSRG